MLILFPTCVFQKKKKSRTLGLVVRRKRKERGERDGEERIDGK
jgi:hypothetical protein